jgi:hypothetical protein
MPIHWHKLGSHGPGKRVILYGGEVNDTVVVWLKVGHY